MMMEEKQNKGSLGKYRASLSNIFKGLDNDKNEVIDNASRHDK
jgi:hypothetical protein